MSAVATLLGLLLVVSFIANFVLIQLPNEEQNLEYQHLLQVENQLSRLQATVLAQTRDAESFLALPSPVTLGASADPPFGTASTGSIQQEPIVAHTSTSYIVEKISPHPPSWNNGSACIFGGSGKCASNGNTFFWNLTAKENTTLNITVNGNFNSLVYNISANNDTVNIDWTGGDTGFVDFIINGSNDVINYKKGGSDTNTPTVQFLFWGQNDVYNMDMGGSHSSKGGMFIFVQFVGSFSRICPYGNLSRTDRVGTLGPGGSNLNLTITWWNNVGYVTPTHFTTYPGGAGANETVGWLNRTGFINCAFEQVFATTYTTEFQAGFRVHLNNRYYPPADVVYDQGAVIESQPGGSIMVSPPSVSVFATSRGLVGQVVLVNILGNASVEAGTETAAVTTHILGLSSYTIENGFSGSSFLGGFFFNVTTAYPAAWNSWMTHDRLAFPNGATCVATGPIPPPFTCLNPPPGQVVTLIAPMVFVSLTLTTVTVQVGIN